MQNLLCHHHDPGTLFGILFVKFLTIIVILPEIEDHLISFYYYSLLCSIFLLSSGGEFHGFMAKLNNKDACIGSILMPTRKVLTRNDLARVISGHNFVVGGAFGLEIRTCPQGSALWLIVFVNCICTISSSSICISGHGLVVGGALCLEIRMGPVAHCICNWYLYLYF